MVKKDYINIKELSKKTGFGRTTLYGKLKYILNSLETLPNTPLVIKEKGKATLYHMSVLNALTCSVERVELVSLGTSPNTLKNENLLNKLELSKKDIQYLKEQIETKNKIIENFDKNLKNTNRLMEEKDEFIKDLTNRHDTIILTMSKQLEALNEKMLLLEDKREEAKEEQQIKNNSFNIFNAAIKATTIVVLIIIYFKILYI